jgi:hypothetical protein
MLKLVSVIALSTLAAAGLVLAAVTATTYLAGDVGVLTSVSAAAVVAAILVLIIALLERANTRATGPGGTALDDARDDRDLVRLREELRAVRATAGASPARHLRVPTM